MLRSFIRSLALTRAACCRYLPRGLDLEEYVEQKTQKQEQPEPEFIQLGSNDSDKSVEPAKEELVGPTKKPAPPPPVEVQPPVTPKADTREGSAASERLRPTPLKTDGQDMSAKSAPKASKLKRAFTALRTPKNKDKNKEQEEDGHTQDNQLLKEQSKPQGPRQSKLVNGSVQSSGSPYTLFPPLHLVCSYCAQPIDNDASFFPDRALVYSFNFKIIPGARDEASKAKNTMFALIALPVSLLIVIGFTLLDWESVFADGLTQLTLVAFTVIFQFIFNAVSTCFLPPLCCSALPYFDAAQHSHPFLFTAQDHQPKTRQKASSRTMTITHTQCKLK